MVVGISTAQEMRTKVKKELEELPRGILSQNELRRIYTINRLRSLGKKAIISKTKEDVFKDSVEELRKQYPDFVPICKGDFLKVIL